MSIREDSPFPLPGFHLPRSLPVTLAAALALLLFGGLAVVMMNAPRPEGTTFSGAAQGQLTPMPQNEFMWTATALIAQATVQAAQSQLASAQALVEAAQKQATEQAAQAFAILQPTQMTEFSPGACQSVTLTIYANPSSDSGALMDTVPDATFQIEGTFTDSRTGDSWYRIGFDAGSGQILRGWVQADILQQVCQPSLSGVPFTGMATPTMIPFSDSRLVPVCPPQQILLFAGPTKAAGLIAELPFDPSLHIEGSLDLNMGDSWLLVVQSGVRGWLPAQALPPECITRLAPEGVPQIDKMSAPLIPLDASPVATATPIGIQPATFTATASPTATFTATPLPSATTTFTPTAFVEAWATPVVEQLADGRYQIQVPIAEEPAATIQPGDGVYVLAQLSYGSGRQVWTVVVQGAQFVELVERADAARAAWSSYLPVDAVLILSDAETVMTLQDMVAQGVAFSLELAR